MEKVLTIRGLSTGYSKKILRNVSFEVSEGEFCSIIGPNGAGKTTLLKTISRVLDIWEGEILLFGKNILKYRLKEYAKYVSFATKITDYSLKYSVKEFLSLGRYPFPRTDETGDIESISERFGIYNLWGKKLCEVSAGELQRVIIVQSLIQTPRLLLLDEPTSHLDISHQISILDFIKKIHIEKKITVLSIFHDLNLASEYSDKIILLDNGEIKKIGTCFEVMDYKILEDVYKTTVVVKINPISRKPYVFPVPVMWK